MIARVRLDDVLWRTGDPKMEGRELQKFQKHVNWCYDAGLYVVPNVICTEMGHFPEGIAYLKDELNAGRLEAIDLHGWDHGPYVGRSEAEILEHLEQSMAWFEETLEILPVRWVTPHGAWSPTIFDAARKVGLVVETTAHPVLDQKMVDGRLKVGSDLDFLEGKVIMAHWWERGLALYRITQSIKHGGVKPAIEATKQTLDEKSWGICWKGW